MKYYRLCFTTGLMVFSGLLQAADTGCPAYREFSPGALQGTSQQLVSELAAPLNQAPAPMLASYLDNSASSESSSDYVLRNYARVALAAAQLNRQSYEDARQTLAQVELDSPAAVRAALMLAESYRLQGQHTVAAKWMLRIADRYSSNPDALSGLLLAAEDAAERGEIANALAVYSRVLEKSLGNIDEVRGLKQTPEELYQVVIGARIDNTRAVTSEVIQRTLSHTGPESLVHYARLKRIDGEIACLKRQEETLRESSFSASLGSAKDNAFVTMLNNEKRLTRADIEKFEVQLSAASPYDDLEPLQRQLDEAREALAKIEQRLSDLEANSQAGAGDQQQALQVVQSRIETLRERQAASRQAINSSLNQVLETLLADYREMAGEAQLGRAHMKQLFSRVGAN